MIHVALSGATGRMGRQVLEQLLTAPDLRLVGGTRADLTAHRRVAVHGLISRDGGRIEATEIVFEH